MAWNFLTDAMSNEEEGAEPGPIKSRILFPFGLKSSVPIESSYGRG